MHRKDDTMANKRLTVDVMGMTCAACSARIEKSLSKLEGIDKANVNLSTNRATVSYDDEKVHKDDIVKTIEKTGYQVPPEKRTLLVEGMT
ncbi:MAG: heavy-metal-associated domain-containing protein [Gudongella sp.]|nr:heavy-metal-associated domain-containing protein [Gudongella sp.]